MDGAYWVRGVLPARFGQPAAIRATMISNDIIRVWMDNIACFRLDLRAPAFCAAPIWKIAVNNDGVTQAASGSEFYFGSRDNGAAISALTKRNGFCGGFADVVYDRFIVAYATDTAGQSAATAADALTNMLCGTQIGQRDLHIAVAPDHALTAELCASNHVILRASSSAPGAFIAAHADVLPFCVTSNGVELAGRKGRDMICLYPNPLATNKYFLVVMSTNLTARMLQMARGDVLLDGMRGSFDAAWRNVVWDDAAAACGCGHEHEGEHGEAEPARMAEQSRAYRLRTCLQQLPRGWIVPGAWLALMACWGVARWRCGRK